jgi:hypothetical protein
MDGPLPLGKVPKMNRDFNLEILDIFADHPE